MSLALLFSLLKSQHIRDVDHALAISLQRLQPDTTELVCIATALASKAHSLGHSCVPVEKFHDLLRQASSTPSALLPDASDFLAALQCSAWVGNGNAENCVLVLDRNTIALKRYWAYEDRLATALRQAQRPHGRSIE